MIYIIYIYVYIYICYMIYEWQCHIDQSINPSIYLSLYLSLLIYVGTHIIYVSYNCIYIHAPFVCYKLQYRYISKQCIQIQLPYLVPHLEVLIQNQSHRHGQVRRMSWLSLILVLVGDSNSGILWVWRYGFERP